MTKRSSKGNSKPVNNVTTDAGPSSASNHTSTNPDVSIDVNNNQTNSDFSSPTIPSSGKTPSLLEEISNKCINNSANLAGTNTQPKRSRNVDQLEITFDSEMDNIDDCAEPVLVPNATYKRKRAPAKYLVTNKISKKTLDHTAASSSVSLDNSTSDNDEVVVHRPSAPSSIWEYAKRSDDKQSAVCLLCNKKLSAINWSTSCIRRHLILIHKKKELILSNEKKENRSTIAPDRKEQLHKLSVEAIIKDSLPFNAFGKAGLSKLMQEAVPGYRPIHRNVVTRRIKRLKYEHHAKLINELKNVESLSITTDFWSDRANRSYIAVTGHYYTNDHQLKAKVLVFSSFSQRHTADQIATTLTAKLRRLDILHKINRIVSDGAKNLSNAIASMNTNAEHIWCVAHRLHLVITTALALWPKKQKKTAAASNQDLISSNRNANNSMVINSKHQSVQMPQATNENNRRHYLEMDASGALNTSRQERDDDTSAVDDNDVDDEQEIMSTDDDDDESVSTEDEMSSGENDEDEDAEDDKNGEDGENNEDNDDESTVDQQNVFKDCWEEDVGVDPNDPALSKDQKFTLLTMIKCRNLINMIKKSSILTMYFSKQRELLNIKRDVIRDICIRWNSSFLMINSLLILRPVIEKLFDDKHQLNIKYKQIEKLNKLEINSAEWNHLTQLHNVLEGFYHGTNTVSGKNYPSIGSAYFILTKLKSFLTNDSHDNSTVKRLKKALRTKMVHYFEEDRNQLNLLKFHSYFDPNGHRVLLDADKRSIEFEIKQILIKDTVNLDNLTLSSQSQSSSTITTTASSTNMAAISKLISKTKPSTMELFLNSIGDISLPKETVGLRATIIEEIHNYRILINKYNERHDPSTSSCLNFWKRYETSFPHLFKLAKELISTPATSVPAESSFSVSSFVGRKERSRLSAKNLAATVFLKDKLDD